MTSSTSRGLRSPGSVAPLRRRMAAFMYEGVLLFGVLLAVGLVFSVAADQRHALQHRQGLQVTAFLVLSVYFMWFWTHGGQTLAMKTWQVRVMSGDGRPLSLKQALARYMACWLWFVPAWAAAWLAGWHQSTWLYGAMLGWIALYAASSRLSRQRQFFHDWLCDTCLIDSRTQP